MIETILKKLEAKKDLKSKEMQFAVESIMTGIVDDSDIEKFLLALNEKGIKELEITAAAQVMKEKSLRFNFCLNSNLEYSRLINIFNAAA